MRNAHLIVPPVVLLDDAGRAIAEFRFDVIDEDVRGLDHMVVDGDGLYVVTKHWDALRESRLWSRGTAAVLLCRLPDRCPTV